MVQPGSRKYRHGDDPFALLCRRVEPFQGRLATHFIYTRVRTLRGLQVFMANHVFAVWDFMTLVKTLQRRLTCIETPWVPPEHPLAARLVNEIVLGEETDEVGDGEYLSHYALYLRAMGEIGADAEPVRRFEAAVRRGVPASTALEGLPIAAATASFVRSTLRAAGGKTHEVAASLLLCREDLIPVMFDRVIAEMDSRSGLAQRGARAFLGARERLPPGLRGAVPAALRGTADGWLARHPDPRRNFRLYLARHVDLDGGQHGPMGRRLLMALCGDDETMWDEATLAARAGLEARIALWDGVLAEIERIDDGRGGLRPPQRTWMGRDFGGEAQAEAQAPVPGFRPPESSHPGAAGPSEGSPSPVRS